MPDDWLEAFEPTAEVLFDLFGLEMDDGMLLEIASADYGCGAEKHLEPLLLFRDNGIVPVLDWHPCEVLELVKSSDPEAEAGKTGASLRRGHLLRAYACSLLLRSYAREENQTRWNSFNETAIQLSDSLQALGGAFVFAGVRFFAWCLEHLAPLDRQGAEAAFLGLALLSLAVRHQPANDEAIISLCQWIDQRVAPLLLEKPWWSAEPMNWLLSSNYHSLKRTRWAELGSELRLWAESQPLTDKAIWVGLIGCLLAED